MATGVWLLHLLEMTNMTATLALRCINTAIVQAKTRTVTSNMHDSICIVQTAKLNFLTIE